MNFKPYISIIILLISIISCACFGKEHIENCDQTKNYDVIIIGAGLSGITAAKELIHLGRSVVILEATNRIGGRGYVGYVKVPGKNQPIPIDYGGSWIHGVPTNPLTGIVDAMGFKRFRSELDVSYYIKNKRSTDEQLELFDEAFETLEENMAVAKEKIVAQQAMVDSLCDKVDKDVKNQNTKICEEIAKQIRVTTDSPEHYLPTDKKYKGVLDLIRADLGPLENGEELYKTSVVDAVSFESGEDDLTDRGMGTFVEQYGQNLPVCLSSPVYQIDYNKSGVKAYVKGGKVYHGHDVLVTVSTGVLNKGLIKFNPELPAWKKSAYQGLQMGFFQKIIIPLKKDIFPLEKNNSWILYKGPIENQERTLAEKSKKSVKNQKNRVMAFLVKPLGNPIVIGYFGGEWAQIFEKECEGKTFGSGRMQACDKITVDTVKHALSNIYGADISKVIDEHEIQVTRWSLEPYTLGAYSYASTSNSKLHAELAKPIAIDKDGQSIDRLFFAGEACSRPIYNGSFAGAYETGLRAARDINNSLSDEFE